MKTKNGSNEETRKRMILWMQNFNEIDWFYRLPKRKKRKLAVWVQNRVAIKMLTTIND